LRLTGLSESISSQDSDGDDSLAAKELIAKKYLVNLSREERGRLDEFIRKGKRTAQLLTKARILLKADASETGEGWSDNAARSSVL
jgi:hypothetical protein